MPKPKKRSVKKLGATTKRARRIRTEGEFIARLQELARDTRSPVRSIGNFLWDPDTIRAAREAQLRGDFKLASKLSTAMGTDAALYSSRLNRLAPMRGLPTMLMPADTSARAMRIAAEGEALFGKKGVALPRDHTVSLHRRYVDHGVSFGYNVVTPRADGSRLDIELRAWPQEFVRWREWERSFYALTRDGGEEKIEHGDGKWVVFQHEKFSPWEEGALVPGALVWEDRAFGIRDRSTASRSLGSPKFVGKMGKGMSIETDDGNGGRMLTPEAQALLDMLEAFHAQELPIGLLPDGASLDLVVNQSQAWQIWNEIIKTNDQDARNVYLGQDGTTQNSGGNYIKSERLWGVRNDLIESDIEVFSEAILTGVIEPWCAMNFGDSKFAPARVWLMPDADEDARRTSIGEHSALFFRDLNTMISMGFTVDQDRVDALAKDYGITPPQIGSGGLKSMTGQVATAPPSAPSSPGSTPTSITSWRPVGARIQRRAA